MIPRAPRRQSAPNGGWAQLVNLRGLVIPRRLFRARTQVQRYSYVRRDGTSRGSRPAVRTGKAAVGEVEHNRISSVLPG
jgi:hypothetical protein